MHSPASPRYSPTSPQHMASPTSPRYCKSSGSGSLRPYQLISSLQHPPRLSTPRPPLITHPRRPFTAPRRRVIRLQVRTHRTPISREVQVVAQTPGTIPRHPLGSNCCLFPVLHLLHSGNNTIRYLICSLVHSHSCQPSSPKKIPVEFFV